MGNNRGQFFKNFLIFSFGVFGFSALIFQVVFAKNLVLLFGLTAPAIATVLAVYFSGLALGSLFFGKISDRFSYTKNLRLYAALFITTAVYGFLFPLIFKLLNLSILAVNKSYPLNFSGFNFFAFLFSFLFLVFPAILIGAGFPVLNKILIRQETEIGKKASLIYFVETFGSVIGATFAGFWLIPSFGNNATIFTAAGLNIFLGAILFLFFAKGIKGEKWDEEGKKANLEAKPPSGEDKGEIGGGVHNPLFLYALFITGFLALALEVLYTKTLILFIGSSTYAFSLILITFLFGIALGSWALSFFADRIQRGYAYFGMLLGLIGFWLFLTLQFFEKVPFWYLNFLGSRESFEFGSILLSQSLVTFHVIFPATFLMGVIFPLGIHLARPHITNLGWGVGKLYFANTFGGVLGSLLTGFLFLPVFGYTRTLVLILAIYFILGGFFIAREKGVGWMVKGVFIFFFAFWAIFGALSSPWGKKNLTMGSFVYAPLYIGYGIDTVREAIESDKVLFYKEGLSNVAVMQRGTNRILKVNGKVDASDSLGDLETEILLGALPMILHPNPENVLVIGLGSGITLGSITQFDEAKSIDVAEIDPAIIEAAGYFKQSNHDALNDPRVKTILADGRNHLMLTDEKYDVISSQPSNIWISGNANLFTKDFYELAKSRLENDGLMLQWIQTYSLTPEDVRSIYRTFLEVFPEAYLFNSSNASDMLIIGSLQEDGKVLDFEALSQRMSDSKVAAELRRVNIMSPYEFLAYLVAEGNGLNEFSSDANINTDNKNFLEFSAAKSIYKSTVAEALLDVDELRARLNLFTFGLEEGEELELLKKYFEFRKALLPAQAALSESMLFDAVDNYSKARDAFGLILPSIEARIIQGCDIASIAARQDEGTEAAKEVWDRCEEVFGPVYFDIGQFDNTQ